MAKIVINGRFLGMRITGAQRFAFEIVSALDKIVLPGQYEIAVPQDVDPSIELRNISIVHVGRLKNRLWEHISLPLYAKKQKAIVLSLCNVAPLLNPGIAAILDMKVFAHPEFFSKKFVLWYRLLFRNIVLRSKRILTISDFSKKEIEKYYKSSVGRVSVVPCAWQHLEKVRADEKALEKYSLTEKGFFFSMSSLDPNKNFKWIAAVAQRNPKQIFAIAGGMNVKVFSNKFDFDVPDNLNFLGYVTDEEAKALMQNCTAFLFPSFYEGFGIPPLEALSMGVSVIVSDIPVMREIFGNTVRYIDPYNVDVDLEKKMTEPVEDSTPVLEKYSWEGGAKIMNRHLKGIVLN